MDGHFVLDLIYWLLSVGSGRNLGWAWRVWYFILTFCLHCLPVGYLVNVSSIYLAQIWNAWTWLVLFIGKFEFWRCYTLNCMLSLISKTLIWIRLCIFYQNYLRGWSWYSLVLASLLVVLNLQWLIYLLLFLLNRYGSDVFLQLMNIQ